MLCPPRWACLRSCLPPCLPSGLGCCVRLAGLVFLLSAVLSPVLSAILAGMLCPPRWAVSGLVSELVSHLVWDALSPPWSCLSLVSGLVSQLLSLFCLVACLSSGMLCLPPPWACLFLSLVLSPSLSPIWSGMLCSPSWLVSQPSLSPVFLSHPVFQLVWCVRALGLSPKFHVRFAQLFGVYGGVISETEISSKENWKLFLLIEIQGNGETLRHVIGLKIQRQVDNAANCCCCGNQNGNSCSKVNCHLCKRKSAAASRMVWKP